MLADPAAVSLSESLCDLVVHAALRAVAADAGDSVSSVPSAWLCDESPRSDVDHRRALESTAASLVRMVLPAAVERFTENVPLSARSARTGGSVDASTLWMYSTYSGSQPRTPELLPHDGSPRVFEPLAPPLAAPPKWLELEPIIRSTARAAVQAWLTERDDVVETQSEISVEDMPSPHRRLHDEAGLFNEEAAELQTTVASLVAALEAAGRGELLAVPEAEALPAFLDAVRDAETEVEQQRALALADTSALDAALTRFEGTSRGLVAADKAALTQTANYAMLLASKRNETDVRNRIVAALGAAEGRVAEDEALVSQLRPARGLAQEALRDSARQLGHDAGVEEAAVEQHARALDALQVLHVAEETVLTAGFSGQQRKLQSEVREAHKLLSATSDHLTEVMDLAEAQEAAASIEIEELRRLIAERDEEIADVSQRLDQWGDNQVAAESVFQQETTNLVENTKMELEAHRRVVQQEQMKVMAMQEDVNRARRARIAEEKEAFGSIAESISLDASTRKYVFPPIATMATLSRSPKEAEYDPDAWQSASNLSPAKALGRRKMKYLAEVYVPQALSHLDDKAKGKAAFNRTMPSAGLSNISQNGKADFSKSTGGLPSGKEPKPGHAAFVESF